MTICEWDIKRSQRYFSIYIEESEDFRKNKHVSPVTGVGGLFVIMYIHSTIVIKSLIFIYL